VNQTIKMLALLILVFVLIPIRILMDLVEFLVGHSCPRQTDVQIPRCGWFPRVFAPPQPPPTVLLHRPS
jgi:hypothetical protein